MRILHPHPQGSNPLGDEFGCLFLLFNEKPPSSIPQFLLGWVTFWAFQKKSFCHPLKVAMRHLYLPVHSINVLAIDPVQLITNQVVYQKLQKNYN
jgi:hypothetical protein